MSNQITPNFKEDDGSNPNIVIDLTVALSVSPAAAQGWQRVPIEPTEAMTDAVWWKGPTAERIAAVMERGLSSAAARMIWSAMLAAAPPSPAAQEQEKGEQT